MMQAEIYLTEVERELLSQYPSLDIQRWIIVGVLIRNYHYLRYVEEYYQDGALYELISALRKHFSYSEEDINTIQLVAEKLSLSTKESYDYQAKSKQNKSIYLITAPEIGKVLDRLAITVSAEQIFIGMIFDTFRTIKYS